MLVSPSSYLSIRNDLLNDLDGQRTGNKTLYPSHTIDFIEHFGGGLFTFRPEVRHDHADGMAGLRQGHTGRPAGGHAGFDYAFLTISPHMTPAERGPPRRGLVR